MMSIAEMQAAVAAGADAIGLVARQPSGPGIIADDLIASIAAAVPPPLVPEPPPLVPAPPPWATPPPPVMSKLVVLPAVLLSVEVSVRSTLSEPVRTDTSRPFTMPLVPLIVIVPSVPSSRALSPPMFSADWLSRIETETNASEP